MRSQLRIFLVQRVCQRVRVCFVTPYTADTIKVVALLRAGYQIHNAFLPYHVFVVYEIMLVFDYKYIGLKLLRLPSSVWLSGSSDPSHSRTVVRECCKGDDASQWENGKFDPLPRPNPLTDRHKKLRT